TYLVFPGAVHTRFEHSLGVYRLAGEAMNNLQKYQGNELGIDRIDVQTVKLAGLLHDIGHGPFSHLFEHEFLPRVNPGSTWSHEHMSALLLDSIVDKHSIDIEPDYLKVIKEMIVASSDVSTAEGVKEKRFLYDIVANGRNGIDVDKFDYIDRDCRACGIGSNFQHWRHSKICTVGQTDNAR
uniref:HD domain-containing protein n=1 Tax=Aegilops tauschii subsp. strangulata TaxID=200361 RepID=A0A453DNF1_AEGTS